MRTLVSMVMVVVALLGSCALALLVLPRLNTGPPVDCAPKDVAVVDCRRALDLALPLLSPEWRHASGVLVHTGYCSRSMKCLPFASPGFLTVELVDARGDTPFVVIDTRPAVWTAACRVMVVTETYGSLEPCDR